jgi:hypothetical protein
LGVVFGPLPGSTVTATETPPKTEDPRVVKLKQLQKLGSLMNTLVHLKKMKELKDNACKLSSSACYLFDSNGHFFWAYHPIYRNMF